MTIGLTAIVTLIAFEGIGVLTALPVAARALDGLAIFAWAANANIAAALLGQVAAGTWCDRVGPRRPLIVGVIGFAAGSLLSGVAPSFTIFLVGRAVQGLGAGLVIVAIYVIIGRAYIEAMRPRVFSIISAAWVLPAIIGPLIAGWLADQVSWRAVFLAVLVIVPAPVVLLVRRLGPYQGPNPQGVRSATRPAARPGRRMVLAVLAAGGLLLFQDGAQRQGLTGGLSAALGVAMMVPALRRLLPPGTLTFRRGLPTVIAMRGLMAGAYFGAESWIPLALGQDRGVSTTLAGLALTGGAIGWSLGSWYQGRPQWTGGDRSRLVQGGVACVAFAILLLPLTMVDAVPVALATVAWAIGAFGMGLAMASVGTLTLQLSDPGDQGVNSSALQVSDSVGSVLLVGIGGAVHAAGLSRGADPGLTYSVIWFLMAAIAAVGIVLAGRIRTTSTRIA